MDPKLAEAIATVREAGFEVVSWRCTGHHNLHYGPDEGRGSEKTFGLFWLDGRRWTLDGLKAPKECSKGGGYDCPECRKKRL